MAEKNSNILTKFRKVFVILSAMVMLTAGVLFIAYDRPHYKLFTEKRKSQMQEIFDITVTDNIKFREFEMSESDYQKPKSGKEYLYRLCLETDDLNKFMTENINNLTMQKYDNMDFSYTTGNNQSVHAKVLKNDRNYNITLEIVDIINNRSVSP